MLPTLCLCGELTRVAISTHVICVLSRSEQWKTTNTGHLASLVLDRCELRVRGDDNDPLDTSDLADPSRRTFVMFPADDARVLDRALVDADPRPIRLVVPDATWKQARRIMKRVPALHAAPKIVLPLADPSRYRLRKHAREGGLCTYEAIMEALCIIEGEQLRAPLDRIFRLFVDRTLWSRGDLPAERVFGGISKRALDWKGGESRGVLPLRFGKYRRIQGE
jgi:DTW domain-containing protein YfiP